MIAFCDSFDEFRVLDGFFLDIKFVKKQIESANYSTVNLKYNL